MNKEQSIKYWGSKPTISVHEYWKEINDICKTFLEKTKKENPDLAKHDLVETARSTVAEVIDNHCWIERYAHNLDVIKNSGHPDYILSQKGENYVFDLVREKGMWELHRQTAYWAMWNDTLETMGEVSINS